MRKLLSRRNTDTARKTKKYISLVLSGFAAGLLLFAPALPVLFVFFDVPDFAVDLLVVDLPVDLDPALLLLLPLFAAIIHLVNF